MEKFKPVVGYEGRYEVSNYGKVRSLIYNKIRILKQHPNKQGYLMVKLSKGNQKQRTRSVHLLVAHAFLNHASDGTQKVVVDHKDGDNSNNKLENLQLITQRENSMKGKNIKGYSLHKPSGLFFSRIYIDGKNVHLGYFKTKEEARSAYFNKLNSIKV